MIQGIGEDSVRHVESISFIWYIEYKSTSVQR